MFCSAWRSRYEKHVKNHECERNLSPVFLIGNQNGKLLKLRAINGKCHLRFVQILNISLA